MKSRYRSYVLVATNKEKIMEIDWAQVKTFENLKKRKYKLEEIDFFTKHFTNVQELISVLRCNNILGMQTYENLNLDIYPAKQNKVTELVNGKKKSVSRPIYDIDSLPYGIMYKRQSQLFQNDQFIINLLQSKINDFSFIEQLYKIYTSNGVYSTTNFNILTNKIDNIIRAMNQNTSISNITRYRQILQALEKERNNFQEIYGLLSSIYNFSKNSTKEFNYSNTAIICVKNNIEEFFLREKYYVTGFIDGLNDNRYLEFKRDKNGQRCINYFSYRFLLMTIDNIINEQRKSDLKSNEEKRKILIPNKAKEIQMTLFDD